MSDKKIGLLTDNSEHGIELAYGVTTNAIFEINITTATQTQIAALPASPVADKFYNSLSIDPDTNVLFFINYNSQIFYIKTEENPIPAPVLLGAAQQLNFEGSDAAFYKGAFYYFKESFGQGGGTATLCKQSITYDSNNTPSLGAFTSTEIQGIKNPETLNQKGDICIDQQTGILYASTTVVDGKARFYKIEIENNFTYTMIKDNNLISLAGLVYRANGTILGCRAVAGGNTWWWVDKNTGVQTYAVGYTSLSPYRDLAGPAYKCCC